MSSTTHPATWTVERLLDQCDSKRQKRSGPGGQHRNKVETAVILTHRSTQLQGQASERRSQEQNRRVALFRLRINLALGVRTDTNQDKPSQLWQQRCSAGRIAIRATHDDFPSLLAEVLNLVHAHGGDLRPVTEQLSVTSSQLIKFLKLESRAFQLLNQLRTTNQLTVLK